MGAHEQRRGPGPKESVKVEAVSVEVELPPELAAWVCGIADEDCGGNVAAAIIEILAEVEAAAW